MEILSKSILIEFENKNTTRHQQSRPPKNSYFYFPSDFETVEFDPANPKKILRRIFEGGAKYNTFEEENYAKFMSYLDTKNVVLPDYWEKCNTIRFLQARGYDFDRTLKVIMEHIEWRIRYLPVVPTDNVKKILNSGYLYVHGRDNRFRPILVLNPEIFIQNLSRFLIDDWVNSLIFLLEYIKENCFLPGQIENWNLICDVGKSNILFMPKELKTLMDILSSNYRCRLFQMFIINVSLFIKVLWKTINMVLDPSTQRKIKLLSGGDIEAEVFRNTNKKQIEKRFGGLAENVTDKFFPPIFPSDDYFTSEEDKKILVSEDKYKEILSSNPQYSKSPFLAEPTQSPLRGDLLTLGTRFSVTDKGEMSVYEDAKSQDQSARMNNTKYEDFSARDDATVLSKRNTILEKIFGDGEVQREGEVRIKSPEASPLKAKSSYTDIGQDLVNICDKSIEDYPYKDQPSSKKPNGLNDSSKKQPESRNNTKATNKLDNSTDQRTKPDENTNGQRYPSVYQSHQAFVKDEMNVSLEKETNKTSCCSSINSNSKCITF